MKDAPQARRVPRSIVHLFQPSLLLRTPLALLGDSWALTEKRQTFLREGKVWVVRRDQGPVSPWQVRTYNTPDTFTSPPPRSPREDS